MIEIVLIVGIITIIVTNELYFRLNFPECKNCGWLTKENGKCCGCGSKRVHRWQ